MDSIKLKTYPSGFLGISDVPQSQSKDLTMAVKQLFNRSYIQKSNPYTASLEVLELWSTLLSDAEAYKTFEFNERILKCALTMFGDLNVLDWIRAQWQSPDYGSNHARWIDETIDFIFTGKRREISTNGWCAILTAGENDTGEHTFSPTVKKTLMAGGLLGFKGNIPMSQLIVIWVRQKNGITDLINSLNVLYGVR